MGDVLLCANPRDAARASSLWPRAVHRLEARAVCWVALSLLLLSGRVMGQTAPVPGHAPGSELRVCIMTMGPGDAAWEKFGHNAIWIRDPFAAEQEQDIAFQWGWFDFKQKNFFANFLRGRMWYWMGGEDAVDELKQYEEDQRSVVVQELNLTPAQKLRLRDFLIWNQLPENRWYKYDYYRDNCTTRARDALDLVLDGAIRRQTNAVPTGVSYRWHTRRLTADTLWLYTVLQAVLGHPADRPISAWEEMFLPQTMQERLRTINVTDENGRSIPLVKWEKTVSAGGKPPVRLRPPTLWPGFLLCGILLGGALALLGWNGRRFLAARIGFSLLASGWLLLNGAGGAVIVWAWGFTDHWAGRWNENLLQLSPLALPLAVMLPWLVLRRKPVSRVVWRMMAAVAVPSIVGLLLKALPMFSQPNSEIIALALPANLALAWTLMRLAGRTSLLPVRNQPKVKKAPDPGPNAPAAV